MAAIPVGRRIAYLRVDRDLTQDQLAAKAGIGLSYLRAIEQGRRQVQKASTLAAIAHALRVNDMSELTELPYQLAADSTAPVHPDAARLRDILMLPRFGGAHEGGGSLEELQRRCDELWDVWHTNPWFYSATGELLPDLTRDAIDAHRNSEDKRASARILAQVYHLIRQWARKIGEGELAWIAADRGMSAAEQADDVLLIAASAWNLVNVYMSVMGRSEQAEHVAREAAAMLEPRLADNSRYLSMWGALHLYASIAAARCDDKDGAESLWAKGDEAARRLGPDFFDPWTVFGQANVGMYAVGIPVELGSGRKAVELADSVDVDAMPSVERRSRYLIDVARGYAYGEDDVAAVAVLSKAYSESPEETRYSPYVRETVRGLLRRDKATGRRELREFAHKVGVSRD